jgi:hypothetical protein
MPHDRLASPVSLQGAWRCGAPPIEMRFASGILVYLDANTIPNPAAAWAREAAQD